MGWSAWRVAVCGAILAWGLLCASTPATCLAAEPEGPIGLTWSWDDGDPASEDTGAPGGTLRLTLRAGTLLEATRLTLSAPPSVTVRALGEAGAGAAFAAAEGDSGPALRLDLGRLDPARPLELEFELLALPGAGGVASFTVQGVGLDGRPVRSAVGVAVGRPGSPGELRHGAREFRGSAGPAEDR